tara:strand:+ start:122 stop:772 length:651 start_codon:yes stop_codon:yes gene_type:complete
MVSRIGQKVKNFSRIGLKAGVLVGAALGAKHTKDEYGKQKTAEFDRARGALSGDLQSLGKDAGLKKMGTGTEVVGADARGNIYGGAGIVAGQGVEANPNIRIGARGTLPVGRLTQQQLAPFNARAEGVRAAAGVVGGQIGLREAARDVAAAKFEAVGGRRGQDPIEDFRRKEEKSVGSSVVVGGEGASFTAKESAGILGRRAGRAVGKLNPLRFVR